MYQVGTDIGNPHRQRQGTGLATVLGGEQSTGALGRYAEYMAKKRDADLAEKAAKKNAALAKLQSTNPDFFYRHQEEKKRQMDRVFELGVAAQRAGIDDPFTSADPAAIEFQKSYADLMNMASVSSQIGKQYAAFQQDVQAKGADYFDPSSIVEADQYFSKALSEHMTAPGGVPMVRQRKPLANTVESAAALAGKINSTLNGNPYDPRVGREVVRAAFLDPETGAQLSQAAAQALAAYPDDFRKQIEEQALNYGISPQEMLMSNYVEKFSTQQKPFDPSEALSEAEKAFEVSYKKYDGEKTFSKTPDEETTKKGAFSAARAAVFSDPRALPKFAEMYGLQQDPNETDADFQNEVVRAVASDLYDRKKKDRESGIFRDKVAAQELQVSTERWLADLKSGDPNLSNEAAGVLPGMKYLGNYRISSAEVASEPNMFGADAPAQYRDRGNYLVLNLETPTSVKINKAEMVDATGLASDDFEIVTGAGKNQVILDLSKFEPNDQRLISLYQRSAKEQGVLYKGPQYTPSDLKVEDLLSPNPAPTSAPPKPVKFNF